MHVFSQESERSCSSGLELFQQCGICLFGFFFYYRYTEYASEVIPVLSTNGYWLRVVNVMAVTFIDRVNRTPSVISF
jgi:hypothetical protein